MSIILQSPTEGPWAQSVPAWSPFLPTPGSASADFFFSTCSDCRMDSLTDFYLDFLRAETRCRNKDAVLLWRAYILCMPRYRPDDTRWAFCVLADRLIINLDSLFVRDGLNQARPLPTVTFWLEAWGNAWGRPIATIAFAFGPAVITVFPN